MQKTDNDDDNNIDIDHSQRDAIRMIIKWYQYQSQPMWCDKKDENINDDDDIDHDNDHEQCDTMKMMIML